MRSASGDGCKRHDRSEYGLVSNGTERTIFQRHFDLGTHWDRWVRYPFFPGYATVGRILEIGPDVSPAEVGRRVAVRAPHASHHVVGLRQCIPIPDTVGFEDAVWFALAKIGFLATWATKISLGTAVLVIGGGPVAQMLIRWLALGSARAVGVLTNDPMRLDAARAGGAKVILKGYTHEHSNSDIEKSFGTRPHIVFDCTDSPDVFGWALGVVANYGRVVAIGDPGSPDRRRLTSDVLLRAVTVTGIHDHSTYGRWTEHDISKIFFEKISRGLFDLRGLCAHTFLPDHAPAAYTLLDQRLNGVLGIRFDWRQ